MEKATRLLLNYAGLVLSNDDINNFIKESINDEYMCEMSYDDK